MPSGRVTRALPLGGGALALFAGLSFTVAACTSGATGPRPRPTSSAVESGMTAVPEQTTCFVEKDLSLDPPVRARELWPGGFEERSVATRVTRQSSPGCAPTARPAATCEDVRFPWVFAGERETYSWTGARRVVAGIVAARLAAGSDPSKGALAVEYVALRFDAGDPARATTGAMLTALVRRCGNGRPGTLGGLNGLVGTQHGFFGAAEPGRGVLVSEGDDLLWLSVDGDAWSRDTERRALGVVADRARAR